MSFDKKESPRQCILDSTNHIFWWHFLWKISEKKSKSTMSFWVDRGIIFYPFAQVQIAPVTSDMSVMTRVPRLLEPTSWDIVWRGTGLDSGMQKIKLSTRIFMFRCKDKANLFLFILCQQDSCMASERVLARKKKKILFLFLKTLVFWWWALH